MVLLLIWGLNWNHDPDRYLVCNINVPLCCCWDSKTCCFESKADPLHCHCHLISITVLLFFPCSHHVSFVHPLHLWLRCWQLQHLKPVLPWTSPHYMATYLGNRPSQGDKATGDALASRAWITLIIIPETSKMLVYCRPEWQQPCQTDILQVLLGWWWWRWWWGVHILCIVYTYRTTCRFSVPGTWHMQEVVITLIKQS